MPSQFQPLRMQIKHCCEVGEVFASLNLSISGREEVGFSRKSPSLEIRTTSSMWRHNVFYYAAATALSSIRAVWDNALFSIK